MRYRGPLSVLWPVPLFACAVPSALLSAAGPPVTARVSTVTINPREVVILHLRPDFESTIRMPEEVTSVILGSPGRFKAEHSEGEPEYVFVKPVTREAAQSNLLIATRGGQHVTLELISDSSGPVVDFLVEFRAARGFLIPAGPGDPPPPVRTPPAEHGEPAAGSAPDQAPDLASDLDGELAREERVNAPAWTRWPDRQLQTAIGVVRRSGDRTVVSFSLLNVSDQSVEIAPPGIQMAGGRAAGRGRRARVVLSDQIEIRDYRLSALRLQPGERADGAVVFDRPEFKQSTERLLLEIAQADAVDRPILIPLPFTPAASARREAEGEGADHE